MKWFVLLLVLALFGAWFFGRQNSSTAPSKPAAASPAPSAPSINFAAKATEIGRIAAEQKVELVEFRQTGPQGALLRVRWTGGSAATGGDFLSALLARGLIIDFQLPGATDQGVQYDAQGRRIWWANYSVSM